MEIEVSGWQCADYIQNEDGMWPTSGTFTFSAEPEDGYELADGCAPLAVEVVVSDEVAMLAAEERQMVLVISKVTNNTTKTNQRAYFWDDNKVTYEDTGSVSVDNVSVQRVGDKFALTIPNNWSGYTLYFMGGTWEVSMVGTSNVGGISESYGILIDNNTDVTITGGEWNVSGSSAGIAIASNAKLTISNGSINAIGKEESSYNASGVRVDGNLTVTGGTIEANGKIGILLTKNGTLNINAGKVKAGCTSEAGTAIQLNGAKAEISDGLLDVSGQKMNLNNSNIAIKNGTIKVGELVIGSGSNLTNYENGTLEINRSTITILDNAQLNNQGTLRINVDCSKNWILENAEKFVNTGKLEGTGSIPNSLRKKAVLDWKISVPSQFKDIKQINIKDYIQVKSGPDTLNYQLDENKSTGGGSINDGVLTVTSAGYFYITIQFPGNGFYNASNTLYFKTSVLPGEYTGNTVYVDTYNDVYDGQAHQMLTVSTGNENDVITCKPSRVENDSKVTPVRVENEKQTRYQKKGYTYVLYVNGNKVTEQTPVVINGIAYPAKEGSTSSRYFAANIAAKSIADSDIEIHVEPESVTYDGEAHKPTITVIDTRNAVPSDKKELLAENKREEAGYYDYDVYGNRTFSTPGTYEIKISANEYYASYGNYTGDTKTTFSIIKPTLTPEVTATNKTKQYDGTTNFDKNNLSIALKDSNQKIYTETDGVSINAESLSVEYASAEVSDSVDIKIEGLELTGNNADKYQLSTTSLSIPGSITKAAADKLQHSVVLNPSTVDYENRMSAAPVVIVTSTLTSQPITASDYKITYSYGEIQNTTELSEILEKLDAQNAPYTISYQIVTDNYDTACGTFTVKIEKSSLENKGIVVTGYDGEYDGTPHTISVTCPAGVPNGTKIEYKGSDESEWRQDPPSYTNAGEYTVYYKISCPNYVDLEESQKVHISQRSLTVSASPSNAQITYGDECPVFTPVYEGFVDGENEDNSDLKADPNSKLKIECAYQKGSNAGEYPITLSGLISNNYEITYTQGKLTVGKKKTEISTKDADLWKETVYSGNPVNLGIWADGDGEKTVTITSLDTNETKTYPLADVIYPSHAGHYEAVLNVSEGTNYQAKKETYEFEIKKKELKITADDKTVIVGNHAPEFTVSYEGFVSGEDQDVLTGTPAFTCSYDKDTSEVGTYPIQLSVDDVTAADYSLVAEDGTLTVTDKLIPTITTADPSTWKSRVYDGTETDINASADGDGVLTVTVKDADGNLLNGFPKHAGSYTAILSYSEGQTYAAKEETYSFEILPAPLTITAEDKSVTMGDAAPEYTAVYDGFVNGEDASVLTGTLSFACDYAPEKTEQKYMITPSGLTSVDYAITWVNGTLTAASKPETPSGDNGSSSGGGSTSGGSGSSSGSSSSSSSDDSSDDSDDSGSSSNKGTANKGTQNTNSQAKKENITTDSRRGQVSDIRGILTGSIITKSDLEKGRIPNDGLSHWVNDNGRYKLLYKDGTYAKAAGGNKDAGTGASGNDAVGIAYEWVLVNGNWWAFDQNGYAVTGWIRDSAYGGWFYIDPQTGMKRGWVFVNGKWYYLNAKTDGKGGMMLANCLTPDGFYVKEDGSWDGMDRK